eukprot:1161859-Pelagomonas_calceolata.AAC.14
MSALGGASLTGTETSFHKEQAWPMTGKTTFKCSSHRQLHEAASRPITGTLRLGDGADFFNS